MVEAGAVLVELDPSDYKVAVEKATRRTGRRTGNGGDRDARTACRIDHHHREQCHHCGRGGIAQAERASGVAAAKEVEAARAAHDLAGPSEARGGSRTRRSRRVTSSGCAACSPRTKSRSQQFDGDIGCGGSRKRRVDSVKPGRRSPETRGRHPCRRERNWCRRRRAKNRPMPSWRRRPTGPSAAGRPQGPRSGVLKPTFTRASRRSEQAELNPAIHHRESARPTRVVW